MPQINILNILQGDNQSTIVDKVNYNFDQILSAGGGPQGQQGLIGPTGPIGPQGPQGPQGLQGPSGTKWFVQDSSPASGAVTGSNPWTYPSIGDYWLDPDSADQDIYVFTATGWTYTGYGLAAGQIFQKISPVNFNGGITGQAILISGTASPQAVVFSDSNINGTTGYVLGGTAIDNINYENSKLKIATRNDRTKIISFSHSDFDVFNTSGGAPATGNYTWNPSIDWDASSPISNAFYDIRFQNPTGAITISSLGTISGGVNLFANQEVSAQSASENVILKTSSVNKGTFIDASNIGGFLELSNNSPTPTNQPNAPLFANSTGLGLGLGTGQFKQTGTDPRRLAVSGNVTIGKSPSYHTQNLFSGYGSRDNGFLYVEGPAGFGSAIGPTAIGNGGTTGPAESQNVFPQVFISSPEGGPALSIASVVGPSRTGRTVIGNGNYDSAAGNTIASIGVDLTQEYYFTSGKGSNFSGGPMFSYQHKITNPTNTTNTAPVFGITTYANSGVYDNDNVATGTFIQTLNSNNKLFIQANATSTGRATNNSVSIGTNTYNKITAWGGINADSYGTVSIGPNSDTFSGVRDSLTNDTNTGILAPLILPKGATYYPNYQTNDHSLFVSGYQTIGAPDPISMFKNVNGSATAGFGYNTKLKIHRNLGTGTQNTGFNNIITGPYPGSYSNGLEITSLVPETPTFAKGQRGSFALGIGATDRVDTPIFLSSKRSYANTTGFFVSDTGEKVSIGANIATGVLSSGAALNVSGPGAYPAINVTGASVMYGNLNVTGDVVIEGRLQNYIPISSPVNSISSGFGFPSSTTLIVVPNASTFGFNSNTVAGDLFLGSSNGGYTPMTFGVHNGAGLRFYNAANPVVKTGNILRVDFDVTTNTDTPGWVYHSINNFEIKCELNGNFQNCTIDNLGNSNLWERPHIQYKIIGKTAFVNFYFQISQSGWGPNGGGVYVLLPPGLQNLNNIWTGTPPGTANAWGDSVGFHSGSPLARNYSIRIQPRKYTGGAFPNQWLMVLEHIYYGGTNVSSSSGISDLVGGFRGQFVAELI